MQGYGVDVAEIFNPKPKDVKATWVTNATAKAADEMPGKCKLMLYHEYADAELHHIHNYGGPLGVDIVLNPGLG